MEHSGLGDTGSIYFSEGCSSGDLFRPPSLYSFNSLPFPGPGPESPSGFISDQTLELAFSGLNIRSDYQPQLPPFGAFPAGGRDDVAGLEANPLMGCYYSSDFARWQGLGNVGFQQSSSSSVGFQNGGQDLGFCGAHMDFMVGQGGYGCRAGPSGSRGPVCRDSWVADLDSNGNDIRLCGDDSSFLHSKKPMSRRMSSQFQNMQYSNHNLEPFGYPQAPLSDSMSKNNPCWKLCCNSHLSGCLERFELLSLLDFTGKIVALAKDQNGSKFLQEKLEKIQNQVEIDAVLHEVVDFVAELMKDQFGNYFIQKLFAVCSDVQRTAIIAAATNTSFQFVSICLNPNGARVMQKLLESLSTPQQISLVTSALSSVVVRLSTDTNGQHVIRYCVQNFSHEYNKYLFNEIKKNCFHIATDKSGCCVLQCCVDCAQGESKEQLIKEIVRNSLQLAKDPYGNYVIQHLLGKKTPQKTDELMRQLQGHFAALSCDKHGSHVVEKFLNDCGEEHTIKIIMELLATPNAAKLLLDPFGNFVMQKALSVAKGQLHVALCRLIQENAPSMRSNLYGRKVLTSFEKRKSKNV